MGWGTGPWGLSGWGFGVAGALNLTGAIPIDERTVRVTFSTAPRALASYIENDALNPSTWYLFDANGKSYTILEIEQVGTLVFDVFILETLGGPNLVHQIGAPTLLDALGNVIGSPSDASFLGLGAPVSAGRGAALTDIANDTTGLDSAGGRLRVGSDGDYQGESGVPFLRKLIVRRLITLPGEFFHLTDYGIGLRVKEPLRTNDLVKIRKEMQAQLLREPEFRAVRVRLALSSDGTLQVEVQGQLRQDNQEVRIPISVPPPQVEL